MTAYYNEIDPYAAQWLRNLIEAGHIAPGYVDERSIEDVYPSDLRGFDQCHFFAGIGVWSYALRRAGWSDDRPIWSGSCPCQPFSAAGKGTAFDDERHLWPAFHHLIKECNPAIVIGEQVASKDADPWIDLVQADLEALGYAFGAVPFPSASVGAPHIRDRLYWVADTNSSGQRARSEGCASLGHRATIEPDSSIVGLADSQHDGCHRSTGHTTEPDSHRANFGLSDRGYSVPQGQPATGPTNGHWRDADWLLCRDGKWRPVEPGTFPLVNGTPSRVGRLRAYGNSINAKAGEIFIRSVMETIDAN